MSPSTATRRRILIISYLFPPAGGIGVQRALSLTKYLPRVGYEVHVLAAQNPIAPTMDPTLLAEVPRSVTVHRAFTPEIPDRVRRRIWSLLGRRKRTSPEAPAEATSPLPASLPQRIIRRVLSPEPEVLWVPFATRAASKIIKRYKIDALLVTAPPFSVFLTGLALKRRFPSLKLICDFRDEWLKYYLTELEHQADARTQARAAGIERRTVQAADLVVAVTPSTLGVIRDRYREQPEKKFACVYNGYDPEMFTGFQPRRASSGNVVVTYIGTVYKSCPTRRYHDALDALPAAVRERIETRYVGRVTDAEGAWLRGRKSPVSFVGFLPQAAAFQQIEDADLLLTSVTNPYTVPGKLFEYLATGKPVLALAPKGSEMEKIVRDTGAGWCVDHQDIEGMQRILTGMYDRLVIKSRSAGPFDGLQRDAEKIRQFARPKQTERYAALIDELFEAGPDTYERRCL